MTSYAEVVLESGNVPESHKKGLVQNREVRAGMYVAHLNAVDVDVAVNQESGTYLRREVAEHPGWVSAYPPANDQIKEREAGNGQNYRAKVLRAAGKEHISVPRTVRRFFTGPPLHQSVQQYQAVVTDRGFAEFVVIGIHLQAVRDDPTGRSRRRLTEAVLRYSRQLERAGILHVVAGDTNSGARFDKQFSHLKPAARHKVDTILVSPGIKVLGNRIHTMPKVSDHSFITAVLAVPVTSVSRALPKP